MGSKRVIKINENFIREMVKNAIGNIMLESVGQDWDPYESAIQFIYNYGLGFDIWYNLNYLEGYMDREEALRIYQEALKEMQENGYDEQGQKVALRENDEVNSSNACEKQLLAYCEELSEDYGRETVGYAIRSLAQTFGTETDENMENCVSEMVEFVDGSLSEYDLGDVYNAFVEVVFNETGDMKPTPEFQQLVGLVRNYIAQLGGRYDETTIQQATEELYYELD